MLMIKSVWIQDPKYSNGFKMKCVDLEPEVGQWGPPNISCRSEWLFSKMIVGISSSESSWKYSFLRLAKVSEDLVSMGSIHVSCLNIWAASSMSMENTWRDWQQTATSHLIKKVVRDSHKPQVSFHAHHVHPPASYAMPVQKKSGSYQRHEGIKHPCWVPNYRPHYLNPQQISWESNGTPPMPPPPGNKALLRDY